MNTYYTLIPMTNQTLATTSGITYTLVQKRPTKIGKAINKLGKGVGKAFSFFRKSETKIAALVSYWAVETLLFGLIMLAATTPFIFFSALFLYLYGTYAIFCAVAALTK